MSFGLHCIPMINNCPFALHSDDQQLSLWLRIPMINILSLGLHCIPMINNCPLACTAFSDHQLSLALHSDDQQLSLWSALYVTQIFSCSLIALLCLLQVAILSSYKLKQIGNNTMAHYFFFF
jgi:hypothetical protein